MKKVTYWTEISDYDIKTAEAMFESERYLYVGFMSHQAIEKILKAYFVSTQGKTAPFSHSLSFLAKQSDIYREFSEEQKDFLDLHEPMNIEARYPTDKEQLLKSLTKERCAEILQKAQELQQWLTQKLYILKKYKELLAKSMAFDEMILFGSHAKGNARQDSDVDVAIIVDKISGDYFSTRPLLWKIRREVDDRIEPVLFEKDHDDSGFLSEVVKHGIII